MRKNVTRLTIVATFLLAFLAGNRPALAQANAKAAVNFPTFEGVNGGPSQYVNLLYSQIPGIIAGEFTASSGYCVNTKIGYLCAPESIDNITGHGTYEVQFSLAPNGQVGSISGSFTVNYASENGGTPLNLTVTYTATSN